MMFIYREEYYEKESERPGEADIIIAKHRNGPVGDVVLTFQKEYPKFMNYAGERFASDESSRRAASDDLRDVRRQRAHLRRGVEHGLRLPLPAADHRPAQGAQPVGRDPAALPRRGVRAISGHRDRAGCGRGDAAVRRPDRRASGRGTRPVVHGTGRNGQDDAGDARVEGRARGGSFGRDLLAAPTTERDPRYAPGGALARGPARPADRGGSAPHRRRRRRADHRLGARGAVLDRQCAVRGPSIDGGHHEHPRSRSAV